MQHYPIRVTYRKGSFMTVWRIFFRSAEQYFKWYDKAPMSYKILKVEKDHAL